jgi:FkbM family methyltransferase
MGFLDHIKKASDRKFSDLQELQEHDGPIIIYGAGSYAGDVYRFLKKHDVKVAAFCVDAAYARPGQAFVDGLPVTALEEAVKTNPAAAIVIGFNDYRRARQSLEKLGVNAPNYFIDAPNQYGFFDYNYIVEHEEEFQSTYNMLQDDLSREVFIAFINAKLSGDPDGLYELADLNQYFSDPVRLTDHETFVDCGAFDGDTIASFRKNTHDKYRKIIAFEPDEENYSKLLKNIKDTDAQNVEAHNLGAWSEKTTLTFSAEANTATIVGEQDAADSISIAAEKIDDLVKGEPVSFLKMDIEGAEYPALQGAQQTIQENHPVLAICAYHKPEDLIVLPQYIKSLYGGYKLYLRHHQLMSWEMVLYAIAE